MRSITIRTKNLARAEVEAVLFVRLKGSTSGRATSLR
jgi:hypothetical protein